jgi:hypothetical protein
VTRSETGGPDLRIVKDTVKGSKKIMYYAGPYNGAGVAQGHSLSPLLAVLVLELALRHFQSKHKNETGSKIVAYADDLIIASINKLPIENFKEIL